RPPPSGGRLLPNDGENSSSNRDRSQTIGVTRNPRAPPGAHSWAPRSLCSASAGPSLLHVTGRIWFLRPRRSPSAAAPAIISGRPRGSPFMLVNCVAYQDGRKLADIPKED